MCGYTLRDSTALCPSLVRRGLKHSSQACLKYNFTEAFKGSLLSRSSTALAALLQLCPVDCVDHLLETPELPVCCR